jgi:hypothetical protein
MYCSEISCITIPETGLLAFTLAFPKGNQIYIMLYAMSSCRNGVVGSVLTDRCTISRKSSMLLGRVLAISGVTGVEVLNLIARKGT